LLVSSVRTSIRKVRNLSDIPPPRSEIRLRRRAVAITFVFLAGTLLAFAPPHPAPASPDPGPGDYTLTSKTIWSYYTETPPSMDDPSDSVWDYPLEVLGLVPGHVALSGGTSLEIRSVYTDSDIYFRILWSDVVENSDVPTWVYNEDNWTFTSPWTDGLGLYFPITDPDDLFLDAGCMRTCHSTDWANPKNQQRKFTYTEEETGDLWFWSAGITNPWDFAIDGYVNDRPSANNVGYYEDPEMGLNLVKNRHLTEYMEYVYMSRPVYMQDPNMAPRYGPEWIVKGEDMVFDQNYYDPDQGATAINPVTHEPWQNGDVVAGYVLDHLPEMGLGQIDAKASYDVIDQQWSLVMRRALDTGDPVHDVIFDDMTRTYTFGLSLFGDIMGGGDVPDPFQEPERSGEGDRCVMNKVTNTIGLRFRPIIRADSITDPAPSTWDESDWEERTTRYLQELIHRSGEIHDPWDWMNVSTAYDPDRYYLHVSHHDPNGSEAYELDLAWLKPGMVSVEETFNLLDWYDNLGHMAVDEGTADIWNFKWNSTSNPDGLATDLGVVDGVVTEDPWGSDEIVAWTWREDETRHIVLSRPLNTGGMDGDVDFLDRARTYVMRMAIWTSDRNEVLITYPLSVGFAPDPLDNTPSSLLQDVNAVDGEDSDITFTWTPSEDEDFGQYRVYVRQDDFTSLEGLVPNARISDMSVDTLHLRGIRPGDYHVAVVAIDDSRNVPSTVSPLSISVSDDTPPPHPDEVKVFDNLDSDLLVSWEPVDNPDVDRYEVYLETSPFADASPLTPRATVRGLQSSSVRIGGLEAGTTYHATVIPVDWVGNANRVASSVSGTPTDVVPPPEVRGVDASTPQEPGSEGEVLLKWRATGADDVAGYNVYLSLTPITTLQNYAAWGFVEVGDASLVIDGLNPGATYHFTVTAIDRSGHEGPSKNTVSAIASTAEPPEPVRGLVAVQAGEESVRLTWPPVNRTGAPVVNYRVYLSQQPITDVGAEGASWTGNVTPTSEPSYLATGLEVGTTYYFTVVTEDDRGRTSNGSPQLASVTLPVPEEEGPSTWDVIGPPLTVVLLGLLVVLALYVVVSRHRRYGRILSRRPRWERNNNGGK